MPELNAEIRQPRILIAACITNATTLLDFDRLKPSHQYGQRNDHRREKKYLARSEDKKAREVPRRPENTQQGRGQCRAHNGL